VVVIADEVAADALTTAEAAVDALAGPLLFLFGTVAARVGTVRATEAAEAATDLLVVLVSGAGTSLIQGEGNEEGFESCDEVFK